MWLVDLQALVTAKLLAVSMLSTWGTRLNGASEAFGLVLCRKMARRKAVYSWSVFLMNKPPDERKRNTHVWKNRSISQTYRNKDGRCACTKCCQRYDIQTISAISNQSTWIPRTYAVVCWKYWACFSQTLIWDTPILLFTHHFLCHFYMHLCDQLLGGQTRRGSVDDVVCELPCEGN